MTKCCARCGGEFRVEEHHIIPRAQGGSDDENNLIHLCAVCHDKVHIGVTHDEPSRFTEDEFDRWVRKYDGPPKEPWTMKFICHSCKYRWEGKPVQDRSATKISCPRQNCMGSAWIELTDEIVIDAYSIKKILNASDSIDYISSEFEIQRWDGLPWLQTTNERNSVKMYYRDTFFK